jgi:succinate-semialdehyde dehydrogenase/glutarate-semialdehyde dehydrogenase
VHRPIYDRFLQALVARVKALKVGNGLEAGVDIGPMIDAKALAAALAFVDDAVAGGAKVLAGGRRHGDKGNFLQPTVLVDVAGDSKCLREEIFAPIAVVLPFDTEEQVLALANDTEFGLAAYAFTSDLNRAFRVGEKLEAGTVGINDPVPSTSNCPFGGFKQSGWGRELGSEGWMPIWRRSTSPSRAFCRARSSPAWLHAGAAAGSAARTGWKPGCRARTGPGSPGR